MNQVSFIYFLSEPGKLHLLPCSSSFNAQSQVHLFLRQFYFISLSSHLAATKPVVRGRSSNSLFLLFHSCSSLFLRVHPCSAQFILILSHRNETFLQILISPRSSILIPVHPCSSFLIPKSSLIILSNEARHEPALRGPSSKSGPDGKPPVVPSHRGRLPGATWRGDNG